MTTENQTPTAQSGPSDRAIAQAFREVIKIRQDGRSVKNVHSRQVARCIETDVLDVARQIEARAQSAQPSWTKCPSCKTWPVDGDACPRCGTSKPLAAPPIATTPPAGARDAEKVLNEYTRILIEEYKDDPPPEARIEALRRALAHTSNAEEFPECTRNPRDCPENEGYGCCNLNRVAQADGPRLYGAMEDLGYAVDEEAALTGKADGGEPQALPKPSHIYLTDKGAIVTGSPQTGWDVETDDAHNCDTNGCGIAHVLYRLPFTDERKAPQPAATGAGELTFDQFRAANVARCVKWHPEGIASWSPSDWLTAVTGELGELASLLKMRNRERDGLPGNKFSPTDKMIADELADVLTYLDLLAEVLGVNLGRAAAIKFNEVSERVGFTDRIEIKGEV